MPNIFKIGTLQITAPTAWLDITDGIGEGNHPFTLARSDGIGAIQFSIAEYRSGKDPGISLDGLRNLLADFAESRELGRGYDFTSEGNSLLLTAAASFNFEDRFFRVWYCSDGRNVALVTYNCDKNREQAELSDCERIIRSLTWSHEPHTPTNA